MISGAPLHALRAAIGNARDAVIDPDGAEIDGVAGYAKFWSAEEEASTMKTKSACSLFAVDKDDGPFYYTEGVRHFKTPADGAPQLYVHVIAEEKKAKFISESDFNGLNVKWWLAGCLTVKDVAGANAGRVTVGGVRTTVAPVPKPDGTTITQASVTIGDGEATAIPIPDMVDMTNLEWMHVDGKAGSTGTPAILDGLIPIRTATDVVLAGALVLGGEGHMLASYLHKLGAMNDNQFLAGRLGSWLAALVAEAMRGFCKGAATAVLSLGLYWCISALVSSRLRGGSKRLPSAR